jgi:hypothetical protein
VYEIFGVGRSVEDNPPTPEAAIAEKKKDILHDDLNLDLECGLVKSTKHVHDFKGAKPAHRMTRGSKSSVVS